MPKTDSDVCREIAERYSQRLCAEYHISYYPGPSSPDDEIGEGSVQWCLQSALVEMQSHERQRAAKIVRNVTAKNRSALADIIERGV